MDAVHNRRRRKGNGEIPKRNWLLWSCGRYIKSLNVRREKDEGKEKGFSKVARALVQVNGFYINFEFAFWDRSSVHCANPTMINIAYNKYWKIPEYFSFKRISFSATKPNFPMARFISPTVFVDTTSSGAEKNWLFPLCRFLHNNFKP